MTNSSLDQIEKSECGRFLATRQLRAPYRSRLSDFVAELVGIATQPSAETRSWDSCQARRFGHGVQPDADQGGCWVCHHDPVAVRLFQVRNQVPIWHSRTRGEIGKSRRGLDAARCRAPARSFPHPLSRLSLDICSTSSREGGLPGLQCGDRILEPPAHCFHRSPRTLFPVRLLRIARPLCLEFRGPFFDTPLQFVRELQRPLVGAANPDLHPIFSHRYPGCYPGLFFFISRPGDRSLTT